VAEYGLLTEVTVEPRTTQLATDAAVGATELEVLDAGDYDSDNGGTLLLNGNQLEYTGVVWGETEDDTDLIVLTNPLASAADEGDPVQSVSGGLGEEDWYGMVDMGGGGDSVAVPIRFYQRQSWAEGIYDPPVKVEVSEDLSHIEDAPGRPMAGGTRVAFCNTDGATAVGSGDLTFTLSFTPLPGSLHVRWGGLSLRPDDWTLDGTTLTVLDPDAVIVSGDLITAAYAYDLAADALATALDIVTLIPFTTSGWKYKQVSLGDTTDYSSPSYDDSAWSTGATMFGDGVGAGAGAATAWAADTSLWVRRTFPKAQDVTITVPVEDGCDVYVNGTLVGSSGIAGIGATHISPPFVVSVSNSLTTSGTNTLVIRANDEAGGSADQTSLNVEVTGALL